jgi:hypothetical protein
MCCGFLSDGPDSYLSQGMVPLQDFQITPKNESLEYEKSSPGNGASP